ATTLRTLMRRNINTLNQARFARSLNEAFTRLSAEGRFATAILASYFASKDHLIMVNAGHPAPLWYRARQRAWRLLRPDIPERADCLANLPLGIITPTCYHQFAVPLAVGDMVMIYTDSFTEAKSPSGDLLGEEGLLEMVGHLDPADPLGFREALLRALEQYRGHAPAEDDLTLLLLHHNGADPPWPGVGETLRNIGKLVGLVKY
ncbi:MAG: serine/threonine-protein phosphatase, partial [Planctomycetes bacterium]|nr:serine/threonine-protein phosphatase [Planctomycetota bacterium]